MVEGFYDCHTHLFPADRLGGLMRWIHRAVLHFPVPIDITAEQAAADLRQAGAIRWANLLFPVSPGEASGLHKFGRELVEQFPEITPIGGVHIDDIDPLGVVREAIEEYGMAGLKFHPMVQGFYPWDPRLTGVLAYLNEREMPLYIHTGYDHFYGHQYDRAGMEAMLTLFPKLTVVLAHIGYPDLEWGFSLAERFPQVWLDLTNIPGSLESSDLPPETIAQFHRGLDLHRHHALMGTDYPAGMGSLQEILNQYAAIGLDSNLLEQVMVTSPKHFFERFGRPVG